MSQLCLLLIQVLEFMSIDKHQDHLWPSNGERRISCNGSLVNCMRQRKLRKLHLHMDLYHNLWRKSLEKANLPLVEEKEPCATQEITKDHQERRSRHITTWIYSWSSWRRNDLYSSKLLRVLCDLKVLRAKLLAASCFSCFEASLPLNELPKSSSKLLKLFVLLQAEEQLIEPIEPLKVAVRYLYLLDPKMSHF